MFLSVRLPPQYNPLTCRLSPQRPLPPHAGSARTPRPQASRAAATTARSRHWAPPRRLARRPGTQPGWRWPERLPSAACRQPQSRRRPHSCPSCCSTTTACWRAAGRWGALRPEPRRRPARCGPGTPAPSLPLRPAHPGRTTWAPPSSSPTAGDPPGPVRLRRAAHREKP